MRHVVAYLVATLLFALATAYFIAFRESVAHSVPHLLVGVAGYLAAFSIAVPAQMDVARAQVVAWYTAWKSGGAA